MTDAPRHFTVGQVATVCTIRITPNSTVPIRTGHRATTRWARNIPRAVAINSGAREGKRRVHRRQAARDEERPTEADAPIKLSASLNRYGYFSLQLSSKHTGSG
jgi:hypothetical protein